MSKSTVKTLTIRDIRAEVHRRLFEGQRGTKTVCDPLVDAFFNVITREVMKKGNEVSIAGLGTFKTKEKNQRLGRDLKTGEPKVIAPRTLLSFGSTRHFRERLSARISHIERTTNE